MVQIRYARIEDLTNALTAVNVVFDENIKFKRFDRIGKTFHVTLTVKNSRNPGSRIGFNGRRVCSACWHVYGMFFDELMKLNNDIVIIAMGEKIGSVSKLGWEKRGNWKDRNIGSVMTPMMYSDACDCKHNGKSMLVNIS